METHERRCCDTRILVCNVATGQFLSMSRSKRDKRAKRAMYQMVLVNVFETFDDPDCLRRSAASIEMSINQPTSLIRCASVTASVLRCVILFNLSVIPRYSVIVP